MKRLEVVVWKPKLVVCPGEAGCVMRGGREEEVLAGSID